MHKSIFVFFFIPLSIILLGDVDIDAKRRVNHITNIEMWLLSVKLSIGVSVKDYQARKQASCGPTKGLEDAPIGQILQVRQRSYYYRGISSPTLEHVKRLLAKPVKELQNFRTHEVLLLLSTI